MAKLNIVQAINQALVEEMSTDDRVIVTGEDVLDTPLAEAGIVGTAVGMAAYGLKPVSEIQFMGFLPPALDQIICHVSRLRYRSRGRFRVPMVIRIPYGGGIHAPEHHSESTEAILVHTPGLKVVVPSCPTDAKGLLISAIRDPDPVIFLEPKKIYRAFREEVPEESFTVPIGPARIWKDGGDLTIIAWGAMVRVALEAAVAAEERGFHCRVLDLRTLSPIDDDTIADSVRETGRALILHEAPLTCGLGAEIAALIMERVFYHLEAPVERVAGFDLPMPLPRMERYYMHHARRVLKAIEKVMTA
jgi:pyruvate dehydrogenase E1 component beta subunit